MQFGFVKFVLYQRCIPIHLLVRNRQIPIDVASDIADIPNVAFDVIATVTKNKNKDHYNNQFSVDLHLPKSFKITKSRFSLDLNVESLTCMNERF